MTPTEIKTIALQMYNAVGSSFFSEEEILTYIYMAQMDLARRAKVIKNTYSTTTVASTRDYSLPSTAMIVRKVTWYGKPLIRIDMDEDDMITGFNEATTSEGDPQYFLEWEQTLSLRPIPSSAQTLKIWTYDVPSMPAITSTLDVPAQYHGDIVYFILAQMVSKDEKYNLADRYLAQWNMAVQNAIKDESLKKSGTKFGYVKDEDVLHHLNLRGI